MYGFESHIAANKTKSLFVMVAFFAFMAALGWFAGYAVDPTIADLVLIGSMIMAVFGIGLSYWNADKMITGMVDARPANPNVYIEKYYIDTIEGLVLSCGLPAIPKAYVIESDALNAFATGRDPQHSLIGVTTGLLQTLDRQELEGVIAHEMSHIYNRDTLLMMVAAVLVGGISMFCHVMLRVLFYGGGGGGRGRDRDSGGGAGVFALIGIVFIILAPIFANLLNLMLSRKREFMADATAVKLTRNPDGLVSALKKIAVTPEKMPFVESELSAMFIDHPQKAHSDESWFSTIFSTHPPMGQRIKALEDM